MKAPSVLERRLAELILSGSCFSVDDLTLDGALAVDATHAVNGRSVAP